jgi:hypothetical protein
MMVTCREVKLLVSEGNALKKYLVEKNQEKYFLTVIIGVKELCNEVYGNKKSVIKNKN